ncbi:hypothetical protein AAFF_G00325140 [Aldrovandia affinis]|uniref:Uncharacterized protein n=1 Tax=Aldrovandia affinis TaxID=143900 RepID=A0AAD7X0L3_9TELE|nr:hypothetical protein AAFF_G00325140 [Aldrovandia affinis]
MTRLEHRGGFGGRLSAGGRKDRLQISLEMLRDSQQTYQKVIPGINIPYCQPNSSLYQRKGLSLHLGPVTQSDGGLRGGSGLPPDIRYPCDRRE